MRSSTHTAELSLSCQCCTTLDQFQFPQSINVRIARPLAPRPISDRARGRHMRKVPVHSRYPASRNNYAVRLQARCAHTVMVLCTHNASLRPITGMRTGMATSLSCRVSAISAFCRPTIQTPSITNRLVAIVHTKPVISILVPKLVAVATSPMCKISAISAFCRLTTQTLSITNCLVAIVFTKPVIAILVSKLVAMATTLRHSISAVSLSDSLTPKTHP